MFLHLSVILFTGGCLPEPPGQTPSLSRHPPPPTQADTPSQKTATVADGTRRHPTGMHSCLTSLFALLDTLSLHRVRLFFQIGD